MIKEIYRAKKIVGGIGDASKVIFDRRYIFLILNCPTFTCVIIVITLIVIYMFMFLTGLPKSPYIIYSIWLVPSFLHLLTNQVFPDHELAMVLIGTIKGNGSGVSALTIIIIIIAIIIIVITIVIIIPLILMLVKR